MQVKFASKPKGFVAIRRKLLSKRCGIVIGCLLLTYLAVSLGLYVYILGQGRDKPPPPISILTRPIQSFIEVVL